MANYEDIIRQLNGIATEQVNPNTVDIDRLSPAEIVRKINAEDKSVASVVESAIPQIAKAAEIFAGTLRNGGRVFYVGAGTSGRLGVLDAAECPPTFGTDPEQIVGIISGGHATLIRSAEGVEDDTEAALADMAGHGVTDRDFVVGIAASRRTPYTLTAVRHAQEMGCRTALVICNKAEDIPVSPDVLIELPVGPEVIAGSTRMKSGTAQKMALNMISTTAMVLLGKTYGNLMVDLQARSDKLAARSRKMLMDLLAVDIKQADRLLADSDGSVKLAIVMHKLGCSRPEAERKLAEADSKISNLLE